MGDDPAHLRLRAVRLYALAREVRDSTPWFADMRAEDADELQELATRMEEASRPPPDMAQMPAQLQEQIRPKKEDD
jgi:hypothetical protein